MDAFIALIRAFADPGLLLVNVVLTAATVGGLRYFVVRDAGVRDDIWYNTAASFFDRFAMAYESCEFEATAGGRLKDYFDSDRLLMTAPDLLGDVAEWLVRVGQKRPNLKICFIEKDSGPVGMLMLQGLVTQRLGRPTSVIRVSRDVIPMAIEGAPIRRGDKILLIQDVMRSGFQVVQAARKLERLGSRVDAVAALVDREEAKDDEFSRRQIELVSMMTLAEIKKRQKKTAMEVRATIAVDPIDPLPTARH